MMGGGMQMPWGKPKFNMRLDHNKGKPKGIILNFIFLGPGGNKQFDQNTDNTENNDVAQTGTGQNMEMNVTNDNETN